MHAHHHHGTECHHHGDLRSANKRRLLFVLVLAGGYMVAEVIGGWLTNSLALLADAGHMLSDTAALALSFFAVWIADRPPPAHRTYGYYRAEILAALVNGATLLTISIFIFVEAYGRIWHPPEVQGAMMLWIAVGGLLVNIASLVILHGGREENLNIRGAWLHVLTDALGSVGAIIAGVLIWAYGWYWSDPIASVAIGALVIYSSWRLLSEAVSVLMESAPRGIDVDEVRLTIASTSGVVEVHDLHVWTITSGLDSLSAHVVTIDGQSHKDLLTSLRTTLQQRFGIDHITIQIEPTDYGECTPRV